MATISIARARDRFRVVIAGRLGARDLKRLERACSNALEHEHVPLDLDLEKVTTIDAPAHAYLERLCARGARLYSASAATPEDAG